jgi:competence protein ComEC
VPGPALWLALCVLACWAFCCWAVRQSRLLRWIAAAVLPLAAAAVLWPESPAVTPGQLELTAIDVGQGDSLLVVSPTGQTMLIDAGGPTGAIKEIADATSHFDVGDEIVSPYLWSRHLRRLDVLALSHAHSDHMGGMAAVMRSFRPKELWVSIDPTSTAYTALLLEAKELGVTVRHFHAGAAFPWGGTQLSVLAPAATYSNHGAPTNNDSLVLRIQYGKSAVLLEGDAEAPSERTMLAAERIQPVTLLKIGHHGSQSSTTQTFLTQLAPHDTVISVGKDNTFGHPRSEVIGRIAASGAKLYRTDEFGLTTFLLDQDGHLQEIPGAADN